jgi:hypothetical protein
MVAVTDHFLEHLDAVASGPDGADDASQTNPGGPVASKTFI